ADTARSGKGVPSTSSAALSAPPSRSARPPASTTASKTTRAVWQRGTLGVMQVTLVQEASTLDPTENRDRLAELTPEGSDLVVFPEAFARDFGEPGADLSGAAEAVDGPFATEIERVARERGTTV